jgi:hypothetical protein
MYTCTGPKKIYPKSIGKANLLLLLGIQRAQENLSGQLILVTKLQLLLQLI